MNACELKAFTSKIRRVTCDMALYHDDDHIGGALSMSDTLAVLFGNYTEEEDQFVSSRGHAGSTCYAVLMLTDRLDQKRIHALNENGILLPSHPDRMKTPGVQVITGFLGWGTFQAVGIAYVLRTTKREGNVFCTVGSGECNEGEVFEMLQFVTSKRLSNYIVIVDCGKKQVDDLSRKVSRGFDSPAPPQSIGFHVCEVDGNAVEIVNGKLSEYIKRKEQVSTFLLNTVKGAGIPYFEQQENPHHVTFNEADEQALQNYINLTEKELNT